MNERTVAPNEVREPAMIRMSLAEYYEHLLKEQVRERAARRGIEIVDEVDRSRPRVVAERGEVVPLHAGVERE